LFLFKFELNRHSKDHWAMVKTPLFSHQIYAPMVMNGVEPIFALQSLFSAIVYHLDFIGLPILEFNR